MKLRKPNIGGDLAASEVYNTISYQTFDHGSDVAPSHITVSKSSKRHAPSDAGIAPISNIPESPFNSNEDFVSGRRDFTVYRLKREIAELRHSEKNLLAKLTKCMTTLAEEVRMIDLGLQYKQWDTYGELQHRRAHLKAIIDLINDPVATCYLPEEITQEPVKKKGTADL